MIDINTLTIGSHVLFNGERVKIEGISKIGFVYGVKTTNDETWYHPDEFSPIPITEKLLTELGFEKNTDNIIKVPIYTKTIENDFRIEVKKFHGYDEWQFYVDDCDHDSMGDLALHYLHEAEAFVNITTKLRLIEK